MSDALKSDFIEVINLTSDLRLPTSALSGFYIIDRKIDNDLSFYRYY